MLGPLVTWPADIHSHCLRFLQCVPADEAYFIAKEILATERTYLKDLEVITVV